MATREPVVTWMKKPVEFDGDSLQDMIDAQVTNWEIGIVDAGTPSPVTTFLIWNNWNYPDEPAKDMINTTIGTRTRPEGTHEGGGQHVVQGMWIQANSVSGGDPENVYTALGWDKDLNGGAGDFVEKEIKGWGPVGNGVIKGDINSGTYNDGLAKGNFAEIKLRGYPGLDAPAGLHQFYLRVRYDII